MSKCDIQLLMADSVPAGGILNGEAVVTVHQPVETKGVKVLVGWRTHGRGTRSRSVVIEQVIFAGELSAGEMRFPFAISVPTGPLTFHGEYVNVEWFALATVDLPWAVDPGVERVFALQRSDTAEPYVHGVRPPVTGLKDAKPMAVGDGCLVAILFFFLLLFAGVFALVVSRTLILAGSGWMTAIVLLLFLVFCAIPLFILYRIFRQRVARRRIGDVKVSVSKVAPATGETTELALDLLPGRNLELGNITATLTCMERAVSGSGTNRSIYTKTLHEEKASLSEGRSSVSSHNPARFTRFLEIPADAPPTFVSDYNDVLWTIAIRIEVRNWIDWEDSFTLAVQP
jgi:hypothetical protein